MKYFIQQDTVNGPIKQLISRAKREKRKANHTTTFNRPGNAVRGNLSSRSFHAIVPNKHKIKHSNFYK